MTLGIGATNRSVGTYNILLTMDPLVAKRLASPKHMHLTVQALQNYGESYLFTSTDSNFLEFKHNFNFGKTKSNAPRDVQIELKTFEPGLEVLKKFHYAYLDEMLDLLSSAKSEQINELRTKYTKLKQKYQFSTPTPRPHRGPTFLPPDPLAELAVDPENPEGLPTYQDFMGGSTTQGPKEGSWRTPFQDLDSFDLVETVKEADYSNLKDTDIWRGRETISDMAKFEAEARKALEKTKALPRVYISYGVGNDTKDWAGPYQCYLGALEYSNDGRKETLTYKFATDSIGRQFDEKVKERNPQQERETTLSQFAIPIAAYENLGSTSRDNDYIGTEAGADIPPSVGNPYFSFRRKDFKGFTPSIHDNIVKLLSSYLHELGVKNHIIVLPNLDSLLAPLVVAALSTTASGKTLLQQLSGGMFNLYTKNQQFKDSYEVLQKAAKGEGSSTEEARAEFIRSILNLERDFVSVYGDAKFPGYLKVLSKVYSILGLKTHNEEEESSGVDPIIITGLEEARAGGLLSIPKSLPEPTVDNPFAPGEKVTASVIQSLQFPWAKVEGEGEDYLAPVRELLSKISNSSSDFLMDPVMYWESDVAICEKLRDKFGSGSYSGYLQAIENGGALANPPLSYSDPGVPGPEYLIIGDTQLIRLFLYGEYQADTKFKPDFQDLDYLSDFGGVPTADVTFEDDNYFLDPFWNRIKDDIISASKDEGSSSYFTAMQKKIKGSAKGYNLGYFLDRAKKDDLVSFIPDEFAFVDDKEVLSNIYEDGIPLFTANTKNSNVLSYIFDSNKLIFGQLFGSLSEIYYESILRYIKQSPVIEGAPPSEIFLQQIYQILDKWRSMNGGLGTALATSVDVGEPIDLYKISSDLKDILLLKSTGISKTTRRNLSSPVISFLLFFVGLLESQFIGSIKSLPMFHLSNAHMITNPAIVLLRSTRKIIPKWRKGARSTADFYSGVYKMLGFEHNISTTNAHSEFLMVKDMRAMMNKEESL